MAQEWPRLTLARPAMLLGRRAKQRFGESLLGPMMHLLPGRWKSIEARDVARAMLLTAFSPCRERVTILSSEQLHAIAIGEEN